MKFFSLEMQDFTAAATVVVKLNENGKITYIHNIDDGKSDVKYVDSKWRKNTLKEGSSIHLK